MKEVKTKERSNLITLLDLVVAYRTLPGLAVIGGFQEMRQQFFYVLASLLDGQTHVHDPIVHNPASKRYVLVAQHAGDDIGLSIVTGELELGLHKIENILVALDGTRHPALPNLDLVLAASEVHFSGRFLDGDLIPGSYYFKVDLWALDLEGGVREGYYFLDDSSALEGYIGVLRVCL